MRRYIMKKTKKVLALLLAAVLIVGTGVCNKGLLAVQAETTADTGTTVLDKDATTPTEEKKKMTTTGIGTETTTEGKTETTPTGTGTETTTESKTETTPSGTGTETTTTGKDTTTSTDESNEEKLNDAQQAFVDAVDALDKDTILDLVNAYKENANEETESAFYAEYDKVEGFDTSAYELYQALSEDEKSGVADSYATLKDIKDSVAVVLGSFTEDEPQTYAAIIENATVEVPTPTYNSQFNTTARVPDGSNYEASEVTFKQGEDIVTGTVEYDKAYTASVILTPKTDYQFSDSTTVKINGNTPTSKTMNDEGTLTVTYRFPIFAKDPHITVTPPTAGQAFDRTGAVGEPEKYSITSIEYKIYDSGQYYEEPVTDEKAGYGKVYKVYVVLEPKEGYRIEAIRDTDEYNTYSYLNGSYIGVGTNVSGGICTVNYKFPATAPATPMTGINPPTAIQNVAYGANKTAAALGLPTTVTITTEAGDKTAKVTWDVAGSGYDTTKTTAQEFTVTGTITVPEGVNQNEQSLETSISVSVKAKPADFSSDNSSGGSSGSSSGHSSGSSSSSGSSTTTTTTTPKTTQDTTPVATQPMVPTQPTTGTEVTASTQVSTIPSKPVTSTKTTDNKSNDRATDTLTISSQGTEGWDAVTDKTASVTVGTITVDMGDSTKVPGAVIDSIKGKDVDVVFDLGNGISWTVNGKTVTKDNLGDIDFGISTDAKNIPVDVINNVTKEKYSMEISIAYDGEFGFTAVLGVELDMKNAGMYANLFYYAPEATDLEFICSSLIDDSGIAQMEFTHASDYVIVVDKESMDPQNLVADADSEETKDTTEATTSAVTTGADTTQDSGNSPVALWLLIILVLALGVAGIVIAKKRQEKEN